MIEPRVPAGRERTSDGPVTGPLLQDGAEQISNLVDVPAELVEARAELFEFELVGAGDDLADHAVVGLLYRLEPYGMAWVEEPVIADDISGYAEVREAAPMPISGGEHEFTRWGHEDLLEADAVDILQPDVGRVGGITEMKKVADMAEVHDVPVIPHAGTNPTLHAIGGHTNVPMAEYFPTSEWFEERQDERESTYADAIFENPPSPKNGSIPLPDDPGGSTQLNREALDRFAVE